MIYRPICVANISLPILHIIVICLSVTFKIQIAICCVLVGKKQQELIQ